MKTLLLSAGDLAAEMGQRPGLIPVALDPLTRRLRWMDMEGYHFHHGFFRDGVAEFTGLKRGRATVFESDVMDLLSLPDMPGSVSPNAFIFHMGRCGSTLLARILARSRKHIVLGEPEPLNAIWAMLSPAIHDTPNEQDIALYRRLVQAIGRRRLASHRALVVKCTSFNVAGLPFIRRAFPDVAMLFLYRNPTDVLVSCMQHPPGWLLNGILPGLRNQMPVTGQAMGRLEAAEDGLVHFMKAALSGTQHGLQLLDYRQLTPACIPAVADFFNLSIDSEDLRLMQAEFVFDAKETARNIAFASDAVAKQQVATPEIPAAVERRLMSLYLLLANQPAGHLLPTLGE